MDGRNTKDIIYEVALKLFAENGYNGTSIRDIVKVVGIKESSFYNHYSKKEDLLDYILDKFEETFLEEDDNLEEKIDNLLAKYEPSKIIFLSLRKYFIKLHNEHNRFLWQIIINEQFKKEQAANSILNINSRFKNIATLLFQKIQSAGYIDSIFEPEKLAFIFSNAVRSLFFEYILKYKNDPDISSLKILTEFFLEYVIKGDKKIV